jgi:hypothetical protein
MGSFLIFVAVLYVFFVPKGANIDRSERANAQLDAEIAFALKTRGVYVPPGKRVEKRTALWRATTDTLACATVESIQTVQFLDALSKSGGIRNPKSDPSQTDCISVPSGTEIAVDSWDGGGEGIASVWVHGVDRRFMISGDVGIGK